MSLKEFHIRILHVMLSENSRTGFLYKVGSVAILLEQVGLNVLHLDLVNPIS